MSFLILAINPGSTSTKIAVYQDQKLLCRESIEHADLSEYKKAIDQYEMRLNTILAVLKAHQINTNQLSAIVGRGGILPPVQSGAYYVNEDMIKRLTYHPIFEHASNLGAILAFYIAKPLGIPALIYDSVAVDELAPIARLSGMAEISRNSFSHMLNMRAALIKIAKQYQQDHRRLNVIVAHLGGGISISIFKKGKAIDVIADDEGPFSPERSGRVPCKDLISLCYKNDQSVMNRKLRGNGGLMSYLKTNSALDVEKMIANNNRQARIIYQAMAYQIAKGIGELATVVNGNVDYIIITGGVAYSKLLTGWVSKRVKFIAPVKIIPGENELYSLAQGTLRVLHKQEKANTYVDKFLT